MMSTDEAIRELNMMMSEKVKKDLIERRQKGKGAAASGTGAGAYCSSFLEFICAVTLTNKNSLESSQAQLSSLLKRLDKLAITGHPYGHLAGRLLGLKSCPHRFTEGVVDYFLHQRQSFLDKNSSSDSMVSLQAVIDYIRDYFDDVRG